jgi:hypothetical protein
MMTTHKCAQTATKADRKKSPSPLIKANTHHCFRPIPKQNGTKIAQTLPQNMTAKCTTVKGIKKYRKVKT